MCQALVVQSVSELLEIDVFHGDVGHDLSERDGYVRAKIVLQSSEECQSRTAGLRQIK
jgi:hypothetical protein